MYGTITYEKETDNCVFDWLLSKGTQTRTPCAWTATDPLNPTHIEPLGPGSFVHIGETINHNIIACGIAIKNLPKTSFYYEIEKKMCRRSHKCSKL